MTATHLHVHSHFTLLGGLASVEALAQAAAADGLSHLALTDDHALYGAVTFRRACQAAGVQPIIGMAARVAPLDAGDPDDGGGAGLLTLLATGPEGYRSLCRLSSQVQARPDRLEAAAAGLSWDALKEQSAGLICLSGGRQGWVQRRLATGDRAGALRYAGRLAGIFGERAFLALELHRPADVPLAQALVDLAGRLGLGSVAVQPVYCLTPQERPRLRLLAALRENCRLVELPPQVLPDRGDPAIDLHWLSPGQMRQRFAAFPAALAASGQIAAQCQPALPDGRPIWPALKLPAGQTPAGALAALANAGLRAHFGPQPAPAIAQRLQRELETIAEHGYSPLFLVVADIVRYARRREIPVSTRGSVANSLVAYCAGITTVDPIQHDLLFERFLNPARANPPDIDLDFCSRRRDRVLDYVRRRYGQERVALVATVSTLRPKSAVRETAKAHGLSDAETVHLLKLLPDDWRSDPGRGSGRTMEDVIAEVHEPRLRQTLIDAAGLVGQPDHLSVHPGGLVIAPGPMTDIAPVQWTAKGFLITQYDHADVEAIGLPKLDLLGIRALTVLADAAGLARRQDAAFRLDAIPLDDPTTGDLLARAETIGVFQCESTGAQRTLRQLKARRVQDLAAANAFFKPGPALGGMARAFVLRYRGEAPVVYLHPALEPILSRTKGVLIFQEQILRIAVEIAGLSWQQADVLRRGMSHFGRQEMESMHAAFVQGCMRPAPAGPAFTPQQAQTLWEQVAPFAGYGFNQGHATAYADVSYRSAYLKAHFPAEFFAARLADWGGFHHPAIYAAEAQRLGIAVRPPHVNHSGRKFTLDRSRTALWMGLGQVRDLRQAAVAAIVQARRESPFDGLRDLLGRVALQEKEALHLVQCGALDGLGASRAALLAELKEVRRAGSVQQMAFDFPMSPVAAETASQRLSWETRLLGWPVSVTPLEALAAPISAATLAEAQAQPGRPLAVAGYRLPGWTGGRGFFLSDGQTFAVAVEREGLARPAPWQAILAQGRWRVDPFGVSWLMVSDWQDAA
ncbi:MAG TPA: DNA polymerase III subunit alpha [Anaerolineae bacterium]|nr:DNA polymerase III subunit alpha [Anaerolineae bacterium]HNU05188.1 DNA polymerase III subunit alpha [Anaerolineae bacterium]